MNILNIFDAMGRNPKEGSTMNVIDHIDNDKADEDKAPQLQVQGSERQSVEPIRSNVFDQHMRICSKCGYGKLACAEGKRLHAQQSESEMTARWHVDRDLKETPHQITLQHCGKYYFIPYTAQIFYGLHFATEKEANLPADSPMA